MLFYTFIRKHAEVFQQVRLLFFYCLDHDPAFGMVCQTGGEGDAVVGGGLEVAPVGVGDDLNLCDRIGPGAVDGGVGDGVALLQILDGADDIFAAPVVAAEAGVSVTG